MREIKNESIVTPVLQALVCDRCGRRAGNDDFIEQQEFVQIAVQGGYGSVFGDGTALAAELCQHCVKEVLGPYLHAPSGADEVGPMSGGEEPATPG